MVMVACWSARAARMCGPCWTRSRPTTAWVRPRCCNDGTRPAGRPSVTGRLSVTGRGFVASIQAAAESPPEIGEPGEVWPQVVASLIGDLDDRDGDLYLSSVA